MRAGGRRYQRCPGVVAFSKRPEVRRWADERLNGECTDLTAVPPDVLRSAFAGQYVWVHRSWSPVADLGTLEDVAREEIAGLERSVSAGR